ncbi:MAG TPA: hypothetical protein VMT18_04795 [Planctomycetota bacterium]|nr:hypothetical protein [Planctomycetota bacterium]
MLLLSLAVGSMFALAPAQPTPPTGQDDLGCKLVLSIDLTFWDRWDYSSASRPELAETARVVRGQHFAPHVFVANPRIDDDGAARLRQDLRILRPDGTVYFEELDHDAHSGPFTRGNLLRTQTFVGIGFEPEDALGTYRAEATIRDLVAGSTGTASTEIELVEYEQGEAFANREELDQWLTRYSSEPDPSRIVPAVLAAGREGWDGERDKLHGALRDLIDSNTWLVPELLAQLDGADTATRHWILWIASRQSQATIDLASHLDGDDLALWNELSSAHDPLVDPVRGREDIDELWGMYWPRRSIVPILRLCSLLAGTESGAVADIRLSHPEFPEGVPLGSVVTEATTRVLLLGMEWDPLVRDYCEAALHSQNLSPAVQRQLRLLLESR